MCSGYIHLHIMRLPMTQIFTTRELLQYGTRGAVDQALYRMVESGFITRLARAVFVRDASLSPTAEEITEAKMTAWNKLIFTHADNLLETFKLAPKKHNDALIVAIDGPSSSFQTVAGRVELKGIGKRRVGLNQSKVGQIVYALWHIGRNDCTEHEIKKATEHLSRPQREELRRSTALMPAWLNDLCRFRFASALMPMRC
jgi:hypothetical protein